MESELLKPKVLAKGAFEPKGESLVQDMMRFEEHVRNSPPVIEASEFLALRYLSILGIDVLVIVFSLIAANYLAQGLRWLTFSFIASGSSLNVLSGALIVGCIPILLVTGCCAFWGHNNRRAPYWTEVRDLAKPTMYSGAITSLIFFALKIDFSRFWAVCFFGAFILTIPAGRVLSRVTLQWFSIWNKPTVITGDGSTAFSRAQNYCKDEYLGLEITCYVDVSVRGRLRNLAFMLRYGSNYSNETFGAESERPHVVVAVDDLGSLSGNKRSFTHS